MTPPRQLKILFLNPYHGGSHREFVTEWETVSRHALTVMHLPPRHFKWRIRQAAVHFARQLSQVEEDWDVIVCTALMNAAELRGLLPRRLADKPLVTYFHENQAAYPVQQDDPRDVHFLLTNWVSALAASSCWFNSAFNRDSFFDESEKALRRMPDHRMVSSLEEIRAKSLVLPPGIAVEWFEAQRAQGPGPLHVAWVGRWEHDKDPEAFVSALRRLSRQGVKFRLSVLGESFRQRPTAFDLIEREFAQQLEHFGYVQSRRDYARLLGRADVAVSCAQHEFFGLALLEATAAGCLPVVPNRLVYPEIYPGPCLFDAENPEALPSRLTELAKRKARQGTLRAYGLDLGLPDLAIAYDWARRGRALDEAVEALTSHRRGSGARTVFTTQRRLN